MSFPRVSNARRLLGVLLVVALSLLLAACAGSGEQEARGTVDASSAATPQEPGQGQQPETPAVPTVDCAVAQCIALTFDDGPSPYTGELLDIFTENQSLATLFVLGTSVDLHPQMVKTAHDKGFEIGNHTTDHKTLTNVSAQELDFQLSDTQEKVKALTGQYPSVMRPPYGARNNAVDAASAKHGLSVIHWDDSPSDWVNTKADTVAALTLERSKPGLIMLFHDTKKWTVEAMKTVVPTLKKEGYTLVTVSQLIGTPEPGTLYPSN